VAEPAHPRPCHGERLRAAAVGAPLSLVPQAESLLSDARTEEASSAIDVRDGGSDTRSGAVLLGQGEKALQVVDGRFAVGKEATECRLHLGIRHVYPDPA
jgi:hypothetical protein